MTVQNAIDLLDAARPNKLSVHRKIRWLSDLDGQVWRELILTHERHTMPRHYPKVVPVTWLPGNEDALDLRRPPVVEFDAPETFEGYTDESDLGKTLLIPEPYSDVYVHYLCSQVDLVNAETGKYQNDSALYNNAWTIYSDYYTRTHMPLQVVPQFRV